MAKKEKSFIAYKVYKVLKGENSLHSPFKLVHRALRCVTSFCWLLAPDVLMPRLLTTNLRRTPKLAGQRQSFDWAENSLLVAGADPRIGEDVLYYLAHHVPSSASACTFTNSEAFRVPIRQGFSTQERLPALYRTPISNMPKCFAFSAGDESGLRLPCGLPCRGS
jgi:hypothetical protein